MQNKRYTVTISADAAERLTQLGGTLSNGIELAAYFDPNNFTEMYNKRMLAKHPPTARTVPTPKPYVYEAPTPTAKAKPSVYTSTPETEDEDDLNALIDKAYGVAPEPDEDDTLFEGEPLAYWEALYKETSNKPGQDEVNDHAWVAISALKQLT